MTTFLKRYQSGEYEQVWAELLARGSSIRNESLLEDAQAVARETMAKARTNIYWLAARYYLHQLPTDLLSLGRISYI